MLQYNTALNARGLPNSTFRFSTGSLAREDCLNDAIMSLLQAFGYPCLLKPSGHSIDNGKKQMVPQVLLLSMESSYVWMAHVSLFYVEACRYRESKGFG